MAKINNKILVKLQNYCGVVLLLLLPSICIVVAAAAAATNNSTSDVKCPSCNGTCGNLTVPYPFGIDDKGCAKDEEFMLTCNRSSSPPKLILGEHIEVLDISVENGTMSVSIDNAYECYNKSGLTASVVQNITLEKSPYTFSSSENKLIGLGCDTLAFMNDADGKFGSGCVSLCSDKVDLAAEGSCSGIGCCQTSVPKNLKSVKITLLSVSNQSDVLTFNPCGFAFLVDQGTFNISNVRLDSQPESVKNSSVLLDWVVGKEKCEEAKRSTKSEYVCGENTDCSYSDNPLGYRCRCLEGFRGNPLLKYKNLKYKNIVDPSPNSLSFWDGLVN